MTGEEIVAALRVIAQSKREGKKEDNQYEMLEVLRLEEQATKLEISTKMEEQAQENNALVIERNKAGHLQDVEFHALRKQEIEDIERHRRSVEQYYRELVLAHQTQEQAIREVGWALNQIASALREPTRLVTGPLSDLDKSR